MGVVVEIMVGAGGLGGLAALIVFGGGRRRDLHFPGLGVMPVCRWIIVQEQRLNMRTGTE